MVSTSAQRAFQPSTPGDKERFILRVDNLHKSFGMRTVLRGVGFSVARGHVFTVLGPSGAGKSVLLKCLANIEEPDTALENVALPLEQTTTLGRNEIVVRATDALRQLELEDHADHYPGMLSGGMQKRLALARAIVTRPEMVFFDEPTAGLDPLRRNAVFTMIAKYQRVFGFTALIVTHDVPEALAASSVVALLYHGEICFCGTPAEFATSSNPVVASFRDSPDALHSALAAVRRGEDIGAEEES